MICQWVSDGTNPVSAVKPAVFSSTWTRRSSSPAMGHLSAKTVPTAAASVKTGQMTLPFLSTTTRPFAQHVSNAGAATESRQMDSITLRATSIARNVSNAGFATSASKTLDLSGLRKDYIARNALNVGTATRTWKIPTFPNLCRRDYIARHATNARPAARRLIVKNSSKLQRDCIAQPATNARPAARILMVKNSSTLQRDCIARNAASDRNASKAGADEMRCTERFGCNTDSEDLGHSYTLR